PIAVHERWRTPVEPPRLGIWLMLWLVFRLMLGSGVVKLASGDPAWRNLTALTFHYETQPIPTAVAWYAYQLPLWLQKTSTAAPPIAARVRNWLLVAVAIVIVPVSATMFFARLGVALPTYPLVAPVAEAIEPLRSVNTYGLFAVMTTTRPEIVVEGSNDGATW